MLQNCISKNNEWQHNFGKTKKKRMKKLFLSNFFVDVLSSLCLQQFFNEGSQIMQQKTPFQLFHYLCLKTTIYCCRREVQNRYLNKFIYFSDEALMMCKKKGFEKCCFHLSILYLYYQKNSKKKKKTSKKGHFENDFFPLPKIKKQLLLL